MSRPPHPLIAPHVAKPGAVTQNPRPPSGFLSPAAIQRTAALADALFSDDRNPPSKPRIDFVRREFADLLSRTSRRGRAIFSFAIWFVDRFAPLYLRRLTTMRSLSIPDRVRALTAFERGRFGPLWVPIRAVLCLLYYEHPDAARDIGFRSPEPQEPTDIEPIEWPSQRGLPTGEPRP